MRTTKLSVNLNKFALIRNSRDTNTPNLLTMARRAIEAGVDGITVHPRPDERHTRYNDVVELSRLCREYPHIEFNVEGYPGPAFMDVVLRTRPDQCTLVPDGPDQKTSDHGCDMVNDAATLYPVIKRLTDAGIRVSCFVDADEANIDAAPLSGTQRVELYTEPWARAYATENEHHWYCRFREAALRARKNGLGINAGHDLNLTNLAAFLTIPAILEVSIGHAIVVESFDFGFEETLRRYLAILDAAGAPPANDSDYGTSGT